MTPEDISIKSLVIIIEIENHCKKPLKSVFKKKKSNASRNGVLFPLISNFKLFVYPPVYTQYLQLDLKDQL